MDDTAAYNIVVKGLIFLALVFNAAVITSAGSRIKEASTINRKQIKILDAVKTF
ncbi:hypothetical protein [Salinisphaera sp. G21_0]|uniref:hypothetical protein n=1 Tax=Salinisphaera sp. G21_0 TaxID=2821094 RepID=UPI001ADB44B9|nr:hypothetical protein [Salinisphaera sp. G21_0]MBO9484684.1 hypothetical protein [Salinisphaera sp. G21_0]